MAGLHGGDWTAAEEAGERRRTGSGGSPRPPTLAGYGPGYYYYVRIGVTRTDSLGSVHQVGNDTVEVVLPRPGSNQQVLDAAERALQLQVAAGSATLTLSGSYSIAAEGGLPDYDIIAYWKGA